jgi:hypothetical protein
MSTETIVLKNNGCFDLRINTIIENMARYKLQTYRNKLGELFFPKGEDKCESKSILDRLIIQPKVNNTKNNVLHYLDTMMIGGTVCNSADDLSKTEFINIKHDNTGIKTIHNKSYTASPTAKRLCQAYEDQVNKIIHDELLKYVVTHKYDDNRKFFSVDGKFYWTINATCTYYVQKVKS